VTSEQKEPKEDHAFSYLGHANLPKWIGTEGNRILEPFQILLYVTSELKQCTIHVPGLLFFFNSYISESSTLAQAFGIVSFRRGL